MTFQRPRRARLLPGLLIVLGLLLAAGTAHAYQVLDYNQGAESDGSPVAPERSDPNKALSVQDDDTGNFFSLGFGGWIALDFSDNPIYDGFGLDFGVVETTFGSNGDNFDSYPEQAEVYVWNPAQAFGDPLAYGLDPTPALGWLSLGLTGMDSPQTYFNLDFAGQDGLFDLFDMQFGDPFSISYMLIVDRTGETWGNGWGDGFDLDGVVYTPGVPTSPIATPLPGTLVLLGSGLAGLSFWRRKVRR